MNKFENMSLPELLSFTLKLKSDALKEITDHYSTPRELYNATEKELVNIKGLGPKKAAFLKATLELGFRLSGFQDDDRPVITSPGDVAKLLTPRVQCLTQEHLFILSLGTKGRLLSVDNVSVGSLNQCIVHPREVFRRSITLSANSIVMAHNHPSGNPEPSQEDLEVTSIILAASRIVGIKLVDHIIIGDSLYSFRENRLLRA